MATGTNMWLLASCHYLAFLLEAALSAAAPAVVAVSARCESAYVSGTVTSHAIIVIVLLSIIIVYNHQRLQATMGFLSNSLPMFEVVYIFVVLLIWQINYPLALPPLSRSPIYEQQ